MVAGGRREEKPSAWLVSEGRFGALSLPPPGQGSRESQLLLERVSSPDSRISGRCQSQTCALSPLYTGPVGQPPLLPSHIYSQKIRKPVPAPQAAGTPPGWEGLGRLLGSGGSRGGVRGEGWPRAQVSLVPLEPLRATQGDHRPTGPSGPREAQVSSACSQDCQLFWRICFCPWAGRLHPASRDSGTSDHPAPTAPCAGEDRPELQVAFGTQPCGATLWRSVPLLDPPTLSHPSPKPFSLPSSPCPLPRPPQVASSQLPASCPDLPCLRPSLTWDLEDSGCGPWGTSVGA